MAEGPLIVFRPGLAGGEGGSGRRIRGDKMVSKRTEVGDRP